MKLGEQIQNDKHGYERLAFVDMKLKNAKKLRPPSEKVQDIFREVEVHGRKQKEVAEEFGCKPQYVSKCLEKMRTWLGNTCGRGGTGDWLQRKGVADYVYRERLNHLFGRCLQGLDRSFGNFKTKKVSGADGTADKKEITERESLGNWRWADLAMKADAMRIKFEYDSGAVEPPDEVVKTDEENKVAVARCFSDAVWLDREPTDKELEDARTINSRLEEQRKSLEEERQLLAIRMGEVEKLKNEMEGAVAEVKGAEGSSDSQDGASSAEQTALTPALSQGEREKGKAKKEQPRPQFSWRYAQQEDFLYSVQRQRSRERIRETARKLGFCPPFRSGPPLEVKKGVFIVAEPYPMHDADWKCYCEEFERQEAEAKAAGKAWREPREKFKDEGYGYKAYVE